MQQKVPLTTIFFHPSISKVPHHESLRHLHFTTFPPFYLHFQGVKNWCKRRTYTPFFLLLLFLLFSLYTMETTGATEVLSHIEADHSERSRTHESSLVFTGSDSGMPYRVVVDGSEVDRAPINEAIAHLFKMVDDDLNVWNSSSLVSQLNRHPISDWLPASDALLTVAQEVSWLHTHTNKLFDPTVHLIARQLGYYSPNNLPQEEPLSDNDARRKLIGWQYIEVDPQNARIRRTRDVEIDLCGVAKGWWVDSVVETLTQLGFNEVYVEWGGDVRCTGVWDICVTRPGSFHAMQKKSEEGSTAACKQGHIGKVTVSNTALATSGDYTKVSSDGLFNKNAIHPVSKTPQTITMFSISSVTVATESCMRADGLATAFMLFSSYAEIERAFLNNPTFSPLGEKRGRFESGIHNTLEGVVVLTRGGAKEVGCEDVRTFGVLSSLTPLDGGSAVAQRNNTSRMQTHVHCKDLLKTIPNQLYYLTIPGAQQGAVISSFSVLPNYTFFFALMKPSALQGIIQTDCSTVTVHILNTAPPVLASAKYNPVQEASEKLTPLLRYVLNIVRVEDIGDHIGVFAKGVEEEVWRSEHAIPCVIRQHSTISSVHIANGHSAASHAVSPSCIHRHPLIDSTILAYNMTQYQSQPNRIAARTLRVFSRVPFLLCFVAKGGFEVGDAVRLHILDKNQQHITDPKKREVDVQKIMLKNMIGFVLPSAMGFIDANVKKIAEEGVVFVAPKESVALARPATDVLVESFVSKAGSDISAGAGGGGGGGALISLPSSVSGNKNGFLWTLLANVLALFVIALLFHWNVVIPYMIVPEVPSYDW